MPSPLHPLTTDITPPERFTYPFCYEPHPLCILAAEEVKREIERITPSEGKMFGVLVVEGGFLAAYSGLLEGRNDWPYFVPPVYDAQQPDGYFKTKEREISELFRGNGGTEVRGYENTSSREKKRRNISRTSSLKEAAPRTPAPTKYALCIKH